MKVIDHNRSSFYRCHRPTQGDESQLDAIAGPDINVSNVRFLIKVQDAHGEIIVTIQKNFPACFHINLNNVRLAILTILSYLRNIIMPFFKFC